MPHVRVSALLRAEPEAVYELFKDVESFPQFMPSVESIEVVERGAGWSVSQWLTDLDGAPLAWREREAYDDARLEVRFRLLDGDIAKFEGAWAFRPQAGGTLAVCELDYELGVPLIEEAVGPAIRQKVEHNIALMLGSVEERLGVVAGAKDL